MQVQINDEAIQDVVVEESETKEVQFLTTVSEQPEPLLTETPMQVDDQIIAQLCQSPAQTQGMQFLNSSSKV